MADLAGYTALTETHGAMLASETVLRFARLTEASLEAGVWTVDRVGDQVFCAGEDCVAMIRTALNLREAVEREIDFPQVRMGLHQGSLVRRGEQLFGAPLNLTSRVVSFARGGQILCTAPVARVAGRVSGLEARSLGEQRFKNVVNPVAVFELLARRQAAAIAIDPVCHMQVEVHNAAARVEHAARTYYFCSEDCARAFAAASERFLRPNDG